jgi:hypothetical protein
MKSRLMKEKGNQRKFVLAENSNVLLKIHCLSVRSPQIDFTLSVFFVVYFLVRLLATEDKVLFLFSMESFVDFFTLPPVFLSGN